MVWKVAKDLFGAGAATPWVAFVAALGVGSLIYLLSVKDNKVELTPTDKIIGIGIAFLNSLVLFAAARGINL
jgi:hypothetical protein